VASVILVRGSQSSPAFIPAVALPPEPPLELLPPAELPEVEDVAPLMPTGLEPPFDEPPEPELVPPVGLVAVSESLAPAQPPQVAASNSAANRDETNRDFETLIMMASPKIE
jgi:hypothetical protein